MNAPPRYRHDCDRCEYLGQWLQYDLYVCGTSSLSGQSVVARYGSIGHEYASGDVGVWRDIPAGCESTRALHVAIARIGK